MAGKFTGLKYDKDAYNEELRRSTQPLSYRLDPNYVVNCNRCFAPYGPRNGQDDAIAVGEQIDVDSILRGFNNINTKSNKEQEPKSIKQFKTFIPNDCSPFLEPEYTRFTYPAYDIKGLNVPDLNLSYPLQDPQCQIFENFEVNTRLQEKDNFRAVWQVPLDQRDLLPTERLGRVKNCKVTLDCNYAPFN